MPAKKSKRKSNSNIKRKALRARPILKNLCIVMVLGENKYYTVMNHKTLEEVLVTREQADLIANLPWQWDVECSVICRDQSGEEYIPSMGLRCKSHYRYSDPRLNDFLNKYHRELLAKQNDLHVATLAWIASPVLDTQTVLELETIKSIYTKLGAFEYLSKWESDNQEKAA